MMTPLRQRMLEELQRRNYCTGTIRLYLRHVAEASVNWTGVDEPAFRVQTFTVAEFPDNCPGYHVCNFWVSVISTMTASPIWSAHCSTTQVQVS